MPSAKHFGTQRPSRPFGSLVSTFDVHVANAEPENAAEVGSQSNDLSQVSWP
jgi:hypothetical protein